MTKVTKKLKATPVAPDAPRAYTVDEVREKFLAHARGMIDYWADLPDTEGARTVHDRISGAVFSLLVAIDGGSMGLPGFILAPAPHPDDQEFHENNGENWFPYIDPEDPATTDIAGCLHELLKSHRPYTGVLIAETPAEAIPPDQPPALDPRQCCARDFDFDGNCDRHPAKGGRNG